MEKDRSKHVRKNYLLPPLGILPGALPSQIIGILKKRKWKRSTLREREILDRVIIFGCERELFCALWLPKYLWILCDFSGFSGVGKSGFALKFGGFFLFWNFRFLFVDLGRLLLWPH